MPLWDYIKGLASDAWNWGRDIIQGIIDGIQSAIGWLADCVTNVADTIRDFLHFSVPDKGPLTDYESWMPDFMKGLADGIDKSKKYVEKAVGGVAKAMQLTMDSDLNYSLNGISGAIVGGSSGGTVRLVQQKLNALGEKLSTDGKYGASTAAAVERYQRRNGLTADGAVGKATWEKMF